MLDVDGRNDADPCVENLHHVLPPLGVFAPLDVGVGQFVHDNDLGTEVGIVHRTRYLIIAGEIRRRKIVGRTVGLGVVSHLCEAAAQFHQIDDVARRTEVDEFVEQYARRYRRIEIGIVVHGQRTRPVVTTRNVQEHGIAPRDLNQTVEAVGLAFVVIVVRLDALYGVCQRVNAGLFELLGRLGCFAEHAVDDAAAEIELHVESGAQLAAVLEQKVRAQLQRTDISLTIHAVTLRIGAFGLAHGAVVARKIDTAAQHQVETFVEMQVERRVSEDAVAVERIEAFVGHEIGIVLGARQVGILLHARIDPVIACPVHVDVGRHAPQRVHDRRLAVTHLRQVVAIAAIVSDRRIHRQPIVDLVMRIELYRLSHGG